MDRTSTHDHEVTTSEARRGRRPFAVGAALGLAGLLAPLAPSAPVSAAPCTLASPAAAAQAVGTPFCERVYDTELTQDGTVYRTAIDADGVEIDLALDVWEPVGDPADQLRPALLWMHGGYFEFGDRKNNQATIEDFTSRGFVVVSIDYRKRPLPQGQFAVPLPEAVQDTLDDAVDAVAWIHANAVALRIDPASVIASGYSAGGITALGLAHKPTPVSAPGSTIPIAAAVSFSGLDLHGDPPSRPDDVPVLMYNSDDDFVVPLPAARSGCKAAVLAGSECDLVELAGQGHTPGTSANYQQTVEWLAAHGISQLDACDRFDLPTVDYSTPEPEAPILVGPPELIVPGPPAVDGDDATPATPLPGSPAFTG